MGEQRKLETFQDLDAWQAARALYVLVFSITQSFPREEVFSSVSQMRRAALSVSSNIAEGFGRSTAADKLHFYIMSRGSLTELQNQIILLADVKLIPGADNASLLSQAQITHKLIVGLIKATEKRTHGS